MDHHPASFEEFNMPAVDDIGLVYADELGFRKQLLHIFHAVQGEDLCRRRVKGDVVSQALDVKDVGEVDFLDAVFCFDEDMVGRYGRRGHQRRIDGCRLHWCGRRA